MAWGGKNPRVTLQQHKKHLLHFGYCVDVMCADSRSGGVSTDCDSTPDFLPAPGSAGLCPRSRAGPTESSASRSAKHTQRIRTSSLEHDVHRTVQLESEKITLMMSSEISQFPDRYLWIQTAQKVLYPVHWDSSQAGRYPELTSDSTELCSVKYRELCSKRHLDIDLRLLLLLIKNCLLNVHFVSFGCFWFVLDLRLYFLCLTSLLRLWVSSGRYSHR